MVKSLHKLIKGRVRQESIKAGFADGRFKTRAVQDKRYKKPKHRKKHENTE
jgi:hypothetical protein